MADRRLRGQTRVLDPADDAAVLAWLHNQRRLVGPRGAIDALEEQFGAEDAMAVRIRLWLPRDGEVLCGRRSTATAEPRPWHMVIFSVRGPEPICPASCALPESVGWRWLEPWSYGTANKFTWLQGSPPWTCANCGRAWRRRVESEARRVAGIHPRTPKRHAHWTPAQAAEGRLLACSYLLACAEQAIGRRPPFGVPESPGPLFHPEVIS